MRIFAALAAGLLACSATPACAAQFIFNFATTTPLIGGPGSGSGVITTNDVTVASRGFTAQTITGITGTFNGSGCSYGYARNHSYHSADSKTGFCYGNDSGR